MRLFPVLGDQLSHNLASLQQATPGIDTILMMEVAEEATYVRHHPQKIALFFSAMRHFAEELRQRGFRVEYVFIDDEHNQGSLTKQIEYQMAIQDYSAVYMTEVGEFRVRNALEAIDITWFSDDRFVCTLDEFAHWADGRQQLRLEYFYRQMRRKTGLLMDGDQPLGGRWNYDDQNRKKWDSSVSIPGPVAHIPDQETRRVIELVASRFGNHFGDLEPFNWAVTRDQALAELDDFIENRLPFFGDYQDAMRHRDLAAGSDTLFHSKLAPALNLGLLEPLEVCEAAEAAFHRGLAPLNAVEGFIRQIIGWREYVRGLYWLKMPNYSGLNALGATSPLPPLYWGGHTKMNCMSQAVDQTQRTAYAHHIQRLMVTGNLALLLGVSPQELNEWYLAVYADAVEWVQLPNTHGMVAWADGGIMASKPYAASGKYIDRQGDYCKNCHYKVKNSTGPGACPLNSLYWAFIDRHQDKFADNPRMAMPIRTWNKMEDAKRRGLLVNAAQVAQGLQDGRI